MEKLSILHSEAKRLTTAQQATTQTFKVLPRAVKVRQQAEEEVGTNMKVMENLN